MRSLVVIGLAASLISVAQAQSRYGNDRSITPDRLKAHLEFVASDLLEGRNTPSRGLDIATAYVATQLKLWGALPGGSNGTYFQPVPMRARDGQPQVFSNNVVAIVPGSDPVLKNEYVAYGCHIDHVGMKASGEGDLIYNGADDDGSGVVALLEIAHALLTGPRPKRSSLFVWHVGEEKGLLGSAYFVRNPTVDIKNVIVQLNVDMIGRSKKDGDTNPANAVLTGPNEIYVVGSTKMSTDLQKTSEKVNNEFLKLLFNYKYDDPNDRENIFYRSDHYNYARNGIPIIFYFDGVHEDYHRVGDEVSKIDFDKIAKVSRTIMATGWTLANNAKRPVVDKPLTGR